MTSLNIKLIGLKAETFHLQATIGTLRAESDMKDEVIQSETDALHKAFYVIGTSKELEKGNIIDKKGGLLGIGKTSELHNDFDETRFTRIDYMVTNSIPINSKKVHIVTSHPSNSYSFEKEKGMITNLIITNGEEFWKASKYLVIVKEIQ